MVDSASRSLPSDFSSSSRSAGPFGTGSRPTGDRLAVAPDSLAHFLTERYRYYTESPWGTLRYASIDHDPWQLYDVDVTVAENTLLCANGFDHPGGDPVHFYSPGVDTLASRSRRARDSAGGRWV